MKSFKKVKFVHRIQFIRIFGLEFGLPELESLFSLQYLAIEDLLISCLSMYRGCKTFRILRK